MNPVRAAYIAVLAIVAVLALWDAWGACPIPDLNFIH